MSTKKSACVVLIAVLVILAVSVPVQYLVRKEVVVGMASDAAHSHAHDEDEHAHAGEDGKGEGHAHEHPAEEGHPAANVQLGTNLIPNFGFEVGTREQAWGWMRVGTDEGETVYRDLEVARSGMASAAVTTNGSYVRGAGWLMLLDELPLEHVVVAEGYIKTQDFDGAAYLKITIGTSQEGSDRPLAIDWAYSDAVAGDSDWTLCTAMIYVPPEATGVWLEAGVQGQGRAWFDDLSLVVEEPED
ncbi:MAG: hypothetical protein PHP28_04185 [Actinomycetota bacterium]|nr:hypothetical protein [Actinomycetota bacterium]MDD5665760.1 hypothetical protein [Actinomycetota bacterium]